jgi:hypothetical protein
VAAAGGEAGGVSLLASLVQKVQTLTQRGMGGGGQRALRGQEERQESDDTQFTCFTSTKVQILTPEELTASAAWGQQEERQEESVDGGGGEVGGRESEEDALWAPLCQVDPCFRNYADVC